MTAEDLLEFIRWHRASTNPKEHTMEITYTELKTTETSAIVLINDYFEAYVQMRGTSTGKGMVQVFDADPERPCNRTLFKAEAPSLGDGIQIATEFVASRLRHPAGKALARA